MNLFGLVQFVHGAGGAGTRRWGIVAVLFLALWVTGCATANSKAIWNSRVGSYTFDEAVREYGPPDKTAELTDHTKVCEWLMQRGHSHGTFFGGPGRFVHYDEMQTPDSFLRLSFDSNGKLMEWKKIVR